jgi:hypothetical protein
LGVTTMPSNRSPFAPVVNVPLLGVALVPPAVTGTASRELLVATPEYSKMAKRNGPEVVAEMDTVFGLPLMFSA